MKTCKDLPTILFTKDTILEDQKMIMKVLDFRQVRFGHIYKVEVLKWKQDPPEEVKKHLEMKTPWILVTADTIGNIHVLE